MRLRSLSVSLLLIMSCVGLIVSHQGRNEVISVVTYQNDPKFDDARGRRNLASIDQQISSLMEEGGIPSLAAAIVQGNNTSWVRGFGDQPEVNSSFQIGSIHKTFTATALLQLYEEGFFELDDDVNAHLPFGLRN